jgi:predicted nucleic acid-binding protein
MILVDTSIWIEHLHRGNDELARLLTDGEVAIHPFVIGELACGNIRNRKEILSLLHDLPSVPVIEQQEFLSFVESRRLAGQGLGFIDIHLLASSLLARTPLWTVDKALRSAAVKLAAAKA